MIAKDKYSLRVFLGDVFGFIRPYRVRFITATVMRVSGDLVNLYPTLAIGEIINILTRSNPKSHTDLIVVLLLSILLSRMFRVVFKQWAKYLGYQVAERIELDSRERSLKHIYSLDLAWQEKENSGNKMKRINNGGRGLNELLRAYFSILLEAVVNTIGIILTLFAFDVVLSASLSVFIITFYTLSFLLYKNASHQEYVVKEKEEKLEGLAFESVNNIQTVKSLNLNNKMISQINEIIKDLFGNIRKRIFLFQSSVSILGFYANVFEFLMILYLIFTITNGKHEIGLVIIFTQYMWKTMEALWELSDITQSLLVYKIWIHRMMQLLAVPPTIEVPEKNMPYPENWQKMTFKGVTFSYGDRNTLDNLNLTIKRGEKVGIVGLSGAGKSTLFKLLLDLYQDYEGEIKIGDVDLKKVNRESYIANTAAVLQDTELFNTTLEKNITIAGIDKTLKKTSKIVENELISKGMDQIYQTAHLVDLIGKLPDGKDTVVGEKGVKLSGGERQRVGIARALYRRPDILLLDEATSHLDVDSEKKIQSALSVFFEKVTAIVIAHRLSTLKEMDRIIVMHEGQIVEEGKFEELQRKNGSFAKLWKMQKI